MKIKQEVLEVLSVVRCDGTNAVIEGQLDRKLYTDVNKVLEALGGKWNRKAKAHLFDGDAASLIDAAIVAGEVVTKREIGFFPTPVALARQLVADLEIQPGMHVLEPSAGTGRIVEALLEVGASVTAIERDPKMRAGLIARQLCSIAPYDDFMECVLPGFARPFDRVAMNPPFTKSGIGDHIDHVRHAFGLLAPGGRLKTILPNGIEFRQDRRHREFRAWVNDLGGEIEKLPDGSFRESGTDVRTCTVWLMNHSRVDKR